MEKFWEWMEENDYGESCNNRDYLKEEWPDKYIINQYYDYCPIEFDEIPKNILIGYMIEYLIEKHGLEVFRNASITEVFNDLMFQIKYANKTLY